jgi:hypothetical protein
VSLTTISFDENIHEFSIKSINKLLQECGVKMKKQSIKDKIDEKLGMKDGKDSSKKQSMKDRRDESKGAKKK